jgi:hypothetical protein
MPRDIDWRCDEFSRRQAAQHAAIALAHVETQRWMDSTLPSMKPTDICGTEFLCRLHHEFYVRLPEDLHWAEAADGKRHPVEPGKLRVATVSVGNHVRPRRRGWRNFWSDSLSSTGHW